MFQLTTKKRLAFRQLSNRSIQFASEGRVFRSLVSGQSTIGNLLKLPLALALLILLPHVSQSTFAHETPAKDTAETPEKRQQSTSSGSSRATISAIARRLTPRFSLSAATKAMEAKQPTAADSTEESEDVKPNRPEALDADTDKDVVLLRIHRDALMTLVEPKYETRQGVSETILGTPVRGVCDTQAVLHLQPTTNKTHAALNVSIQGTSHTTSTGYQGPVQIHSSGVTRFQCQTVLEFDDEIGFHAGTVSVSGQSHSNVNSIQTRRNGPVGRLVQRVAWRKVGQSKAQADAIAHQKTMAKISREVNSSLETELQSLNRKLLIAKTFAEQINENRTSDFEARTTGDHLYFCFGLEQDEELPSLPDLTPTTDEQLQPPAVEILVHRSVVQKQLLSAFSMVAQTQGSLTRMISAPDNSKTTLGRFVEELDLPVAEVRFKGEWIIISLEEESGLSSLLRDRNAAQR